jgi:hypothetical protein
MILEIIHGRKNSGNVFFGRQNIIKFWHSKYQVLIPSKDDYRSRTISDALKTPIK